MEETGHTGKSAPLCCSKICRIEGKCLYQEGKEFTDAIAGCNLKIQPGRICLWVDQQFNSFANEINLTQENSDLSKVKQIVRRRKIIEFK